MRFSRGKDRLVWRHGGLRLRRRLVFQRQTAATRVRVLQVSANVRMSIQGCLAWSRVHFVQVSCGRYLLSSSCQVWTARVTACSDHSDSDKSRFRFVQVEQEPGGRSTHNLAPGHRRGAEMQRRCFIQTVACEMHYSLVATRVRYRVTTPLRCMFDVART